MSEKRRLTRRMPILVVGLWVGVAIGIVLLFFVFDADALFSGGDKVQTARRGEPAPGFVLENIEGNQIRLSDYQGRAVVVNFWATWCGPCVREIPMFQEYQDRYESDMVVLGINQQESPDDVQKFVGELGLTYEMLLDRDAQVSSLYGVIGLPVTSFIDSQGILRYHHIGIMTEEQFSRYLMTLGVIQ